MRVLLLSTVLAVLLVACNQNNSATGQVSVPATQNTADSHLKNTANNDEIVRAYVAWAKNQVDLLVADTTVFVELLKAGKTQEAKTLYPHVRMYFERIEPIAESFGDLDPRIDRREADLEAGEVWTGFHAIEKILWTQNTTKGTQQLAEQLLDDVKALQAKIPTADIDVATLIAGSVDLLNEVTTTKITGEEEIFSKTDLYDFRANVEGAEKIFELLTPQIDAKNPELSSELKQKFSEVYVLLDKHKISDKAYKSYDKLTQDEIKDLAEAVNKLGEPLANMGIVMQ